MQKIIYLILSTLIITSAFSCSAVKEVVKAGFDIYDMDKSYEININWVMSDIIKYSPFEPNKDSKSFEWYQYIYNDSNWQYAKLPDKNWNCDNCDRYYRGYFEVSTISDYAHDYAIDISSDDGIWIYINGKFFGHLGGGVHQQGCVNTSYCSSVKNINPIQIDDYLIKGKNVIAVRVSESIGSELFNLRLLEISRSQKSKTNNILKN